MNQTKKSSYLFTKLRLSSVAALALTLAACGGDGGDDNNDNAARMDGRWSGALTKTDDSCTTANLGTTLNFNQQMVQNGNAVQLIDTDGTRFLGNVVGSNGFSVDAVLPSSRGANCEQRRRIEYDRITSDDDTTADVDFTIREVCAGTEACEVLYTGTASRNTSGGAPSPTPLPAGTITPSATPGTNATATPGAAAKVGCRAMNPTTAAGTYGGTGGCGISDVKFTFDNPTSPAAITLAPFGSNGPVTFAISSQAPSTATSTRSDLTLQSESGAQCMMACSPPGTFTITCASSAGFTCTEKF